MSTRHTLVAAALWGVLAVTEPTGAAEPNAIRSVDIAEKDGAVELAIQGSRPPSYTVFKLQDPPRLVVDLAGADVSAVASPVAVGKGGVIGVSTAQYQDERSAVGRVIVSLDAARRYEVVPRGDAVVVRVLGDDAKANSVAIPQESVRPEPVAERTGERAKAAAAAAPAAAPKADDHVLASRVDEASVGQPARTLTGVRAEQDAIVLATDGDVAKIEILELRDPARLALDLHGVTKAPRAPVAVTGAFTQVRFGENGDRVRVVLDARRNLPGYELKRVAGGLAIVTAPAAESKAAAAAAPAAKPPAFVAPLSPSKGHHERTLSAPPQAKPAVAAAKPVAPAEPARARIADVKFAQSAGEARIEIAGKARYTVERPDPRTVVLSLEDAELAKQLERSLDTSAFHGPVMMVSSFNQPTTGQVKIVASLRGEGTTDRLAETANGLSWTFAAPKQAAASTPAAAPAPKVTVEEPAVAITEAQAAGFAAEAPGYALSGAPQKRGYTGRRITLDFHDIEIRNLLRLIADVSKKNIVVADDVGGKVTVSLRNVPWDQALDLVLKSKGLGKEELGNVIRIAKLEDIAKEQEARAKAVEAAKPLIPLKVRLIPVNYARAGDVAGRVKDVLTERGTVSTDERTNVLIVKDTQEALVRAEGLVRNLDTEIPQVLIESRIVEASSTFNRAIGVQWGGAGSFAQITGNPTGAAFPNNVVGSGGSGGASSPGSPSPANYAVNLPAAVGEGSGGAIGFILGSAGGAFNLNLRLSALENSGVVKTISAPKIATIDNKEATIGQGISIPFSQVSASGVNTTFIEAKLELKVTPHVTADGTILLKIKATNNSPNPGLTGANGQPSISKREAETEVLVKDGDTTVIGGIYTRQTANRVSEVPFLGKIPILGFFFRNTVEQDDNTELLIFITPRILNRSAISAASGT
jgi:type IV pilus assembly protein PilQ